MILHGKLNLLKRKDIYFTLESYKGKHKNCKCPFTTFFSSAHLQAFIKCVSEEHVYTSYKLTFVDWSNIDRGMPSISTMSVVSFIFNHTMLVVLQ